MRSVAGNILAGALLLLLSTAAMAGTNAGYEMGGQYARFDPVVSQYNHRASCSGSKAIASRPARCFSPSGMSASAATPPCCFMPRTTGIKTPRRHGPSTC